MSEITITATGQVGCGKSAILGEIEILCKALGVPCRYADEAAARAEKNGTHADWTWALELYKPSVVLVEKNMHAESEADRWRGVKMAWCTSLENWWQLANDADKKRAYSASIESDAWKARRIRDLEEDAQDLTSALRELYQVADASLDYRPEFRSAISTAYTALHSVGVEPEIITEFVNPPVPFRHFDWAAYLGDYEPGKPIGHGATEAEAIANLLESL